MVGNILVTSASKKVPLINALIKAARRISPKIKIIGGDMDSDALGKYVSDEFWEMPSIVGEEFENILNGCIDRNIDVIIPTRDGELLFWAHYASKFKEAGIYVAISPEKSIKLCLDKLSFSHYGEKNNFPFIQSFNNIKECESNAYVVKERYGSGSKKIGINMDKKMALVHAKKLNDPIFQPYIPGKEISIDAWINDQNKVKGVILRTRDKVINGESQITTTFRDEEIESLAKKIIQSLNLRGHIIIQAIIDDNNNIFIIECNPRFGGASTISIMAGLDSMYWTLMEFDSVQEDQFLFDRIKGEVRQIRVPCDIYYYDSHF